jgi:tRNA uridine 5-carboxymethylaminomethyl modification enzyme
LLERTRLTSEIVAKIEESPCIPCHPERSEAEPSAVEGPCVPAPREIDWQGAAGQTCAQLLKRPEVSIEHLVPVLRELNPAFFQRNHSSGSSASSAVVISSEVRNELKSVETEVKYAGYLQQQERAIERLKKAELRTIPEWFDYHSVSGLSREMQEKLLKIRPRTLGHASRIPGVTPAAVSLVNVYIEIQAKRREQGEALAR